MTATISLSQVNDGDWLM